MLVLSRKVGQQLRIGDDITVTITQSSRNRVTIGIDAPRDVPIMRGEIHREQQAKTGRDGKAAKR